MHQWQILILVIGIFGGALSGPLAQSEELELSENGGSTKPGYVYVEPETKLIQKDGQIVLPPYLERRGNWGGTVALSWSSYEPTNYQPDYTTGNFGDVYRTPDSPLLSVAFSLKRNLPFGSVALELVGGGYRNQSDIDPTIVDSTLTVYPIKVGAAFYLDAMNPDPIFIPYVAGGVYTIFYNESQASDSDNGHTKPAPWANLGLQISMNWLDRDMAQSGYAIGVQNTYVFFELQKLVASSQETDPDLSNIVSFSAGLRVEF